MDSLSATVGSTLPREWVWYSQYIITVENEKQVNYFFEIFQFFNFFWFFSNNFLPPTLELNIVLNVDRYVQVNEKFKHGYWIEKHYRIKTHNSYIKETEILPFVVREAPPEISHEQLPTRLAGPCIQRVLLNWLLQWSCETFPSRSVSPRRQLSFSRHFSPWSGTLLWVEFHQVCFWIHLAECRSQRASMVRHNQLHLARTRTSLCRSVQRSQTTPFRR